jgi:hypothetical protein
MEGFEIFDMRMKRSMKISPNYLGRTDVGSIKYYDKNKSKTDKRKILLSGIC